MTPEELEAKVEHLGQELARLREEQAIDRKAFSHWVISVGVGHALISFALWLGIAFADKSDMTRILIFVMAAILTMITSASVLVSLGSTRSLRRYWLKSVGT